MATSTFLRSGGFRPRWLPHYLSDYEFTIRLHRQGVPLVCDPGLTLEFDGSTTGDLPITTGGPRRFWKHAFSNRAKLNPKHWTAFALMVCPPVAAVRVVARIWWGFVRNLARSLRNRPVGSTNF
jgi:hypothetical protein